MFEQVQAQLQHFKSEKKNIKEYPLRGKVFCGCCNHAMRRGKKDPEYSCHYTRIADNFGCNGLSISEKELESLLFEVISKQAEVILGFDSIPTMRELQTRLAEQSEYERLIRSCKDGKMRLYEQFLMGEIDADRYRELKAVYDAELTDLNNYHAVIASQTSQMRLDSEEKRKMRTIAADISNEKSLTRALVEMLIDKVSFYPDNRIEITWKIEDFAEIGFIPAGRDEYASA